MDVKKKELVNISVRIEKDTIKNLKKKNINISKLARECFNQYLKTLSEKTNK